MIVEVRQGVGGDEAALWAGEVARMLQRYAERRGYRTETLSANESDGGGVKETVFAVKGDGAFSVFKWEGGTHRVQRVPDTEAQGRVHTSTATVAVMPEPEEVEIAIEDKDLKIDMFRSSGPGGQTRQQDRVGRAHDARADGDRRLDAGRKVPAQEPAKAMRILRARLYDRARSQQAESRPRGDRRSAAASAARRSAPTTSRRTASPTTGSSTQCTDSTRSSTATCRSSRKRCSRRSGAGASRTRCDVFDR